MKHVITLATRIRSAMLLGFVISFTGSIVPGVVTLGVLHLFLTRGFGAGILFSLGNLPVEAAFVTLSLVAMSWLHRRRQWFRMLEWMSFAVVLLLTIGAGWSISQNAQSEGQTREIAAQISPWLAGFLLRLSTPTLIPYWIGWNTVCISNGLLQPRWSHYRWYIPGVALGTFTAHLMFMGLAAVASEWLVDIQILFKWLIFMALLATLLYQANRLGLIKYKKAQQSIY